MGPPPQTIPRSSFWCLIFASTPEPTQTVCDNATPNAAWSYHIPLWSTFFHSQVLLPTHLLSIRNSVYQLVSQILTALCSTSVAGAAPCPPHASFCNLFPSTPRPQIAQHVPPTCQQPRRSTRLWDTVTALPLARAMGPPGFTPGGALPNRSAFAPKICFRSPLSATHGTGFTPHGPAKQDAPSVGTDLSMQDKCSASPATLTPA